MSSSEEDDKLFGIDSDDTAELIANNSKNKKKPPAKKTAAAAADESSDDGGLFDSDSEDNAEKKKPVSKKERLEALASAKRKKSAPPPKAASASASKKDQKKGDGYDSENSYDSDTFERTAEDDAFIDTTGEDADAVNELYAEQSFQDVRPDKAKVKKPKKRKQGDADDGELDNPIMAAVHRMKKKKREKKSLPELEDEVKVFLNEMDQAAADDEVAIAERRPGLAKLQNLEKFCDMLAKRDLLRILLDFDVLSVCKRWIQPLKDGSLGNVTVRQRVLEAVLKLPITAGDLKRSEFGRTVMILYKHKSETPTLKRSWKKLIEEWARPIFQKSATLRDLDRVQRGEGLAAISSKQQRADKGPKQKPTQDLQDLLQKGRTSTSESASARVRVPFSKGFDYSVRPQGRVVEFSPQKQSSSETKSNLSKRILEKGRKVNKNQRSANISIEGRNTKG